MSEEWKEYTPPWAVGSPPEKNPSTLFVEQKYDPEQFAHRRAMVRWDGCVHFNEYYNGVNPDECEDDETDYIHICRLDDFIEDLIALRDKAREFFGGEWGK